MLDPKKILFSIDSDSLKISLCVGGFSVEVADSLPAFKRFCDDLSKQLDEIHKEIKENY